MAGQARHAVSNNRHMNHCPSDAEQHTSPKLSIQAVDTYHTCYKQGLGMDRIVKWVGLAGVHEDEGFTAKIWGRYFGYLLMGAVLWLALQWHLEFTGKIDLDTSQVANILVWLFFVVETVVLTYLVKDKQRYLKTNWLNLVIIVSGIPLLFFDVGPVANLLRTVRFFLIIGLLIPWASTIIRFLSDNRLDTTIAAALGILVLAGVAITSIDPAIHSIEEGIWWAWVTISTVGYGDLVPTSRGGRIFSGILILIGMGLFSVITANFAAYFVKQKVENVQKEQQLENRQLKRIIEELHEVHQEEADMMRLLKDIDKRLDRLENQGEGQPEKQPRKAG
jgi:voltage-gated potassium channel